MTNNEKKLNKINAFKIKRGRISHLRKLKWFIQKKYDNTLQLYNNRIELMKIINRIREKTNDEEINVMDILVEIYGKKIKFSPQHKFEDQIRFLLRSLNDTGEIVTGGAWFITIKVTPKILSTLSEYEIEQARHKDSNKLSLLQFIVALAMLVLAISNFIFSHNQWKFFDKNTTNQFIRP